MSELLQGEPAAAAAEAHARFVTALARRVAWQVDAAYAPEPEPEVEPQPAQALAPAPPPKPKRRRAQPRAPKREQRAEASGSSFGGWSIWRLEELVAERGREFPERLEEWRWHLLYLRFHADADGMLPRDFDGLVESAFAGLV